MKFIGLPADIDQEALNALKRDWNLCHAIYDPCTFILEHSIACGRQSESAADRKFRIDRIKEKRALQHELRAARQ